MIDIVALAESYAKGRRGVIHNAVREAFIAGAQALSVATRAELAASVDYVDPKELGSSYVKDRQRAYSRESARRKRAKKLAEGHQWFTA